MIKRAILSIVSPKQELSRDRAFEAARGLIDELHGLDQVMASTIAPKRKLKRDKPKATRSGV